MRLCVGSGQLATAASRFDCGSNGITKIARRYVNQDLADRLDLSDAPRPVRSLTPVVARIGLFARAAMILPVGVFQIVAAIEYDPAVPPGSMARSPTLARHSWGRGLLLVIALGLVVFAVYSLLEAKYRDPPLE